MKILLLSFFLFPFSILFSQGNLQFNQVINLSGSQAYTVPVGKCLKVESIQVINTTATSSLTNCSCNPSTMGESQCTYAGGIICVLAGVTLNYGAFTKTGGSCTWQSMCPGNCPQTASTSVTIPSLSFPMWLAEGKSISFGTTISGVLLTAVEFNIIP
jgi:hypothetical protein